MVALVVARPPPRLTSATAFCVRNMIRAKDSSPCGCAHGMAIGPPGVLASIMGEPMGCHSVTRHNVWTTQFYCKVTARLFFVISIAQDERQTRQPMMNRRSVPSRMDRLYHWPLTA